MGFVLDAGLRNILIVVRWGHSDWKWGSCPLEEWIKNKEKEYLNIGIQKKIESVMHVCMWKVS